jgi:hypothetical protein
LSSLNVDSVFFLRSAGFFSSNRITIGSLRFVCEKSRETQMHLAREFARRIEQEKRCGDERRKGADEWPTWAAKILRARAVGAHFSVDSRRRTRLRDQKNASRFP